MPIEQPIEEHLETVRKLQPDRSKPTAHSLRLKNSPAAYLAAAGILAFCVYGIAEASRRLAAEAWIANPGGDSLDRAVALTPGNGLAWLRLGQRNSRLGNDSAEAIGQLKKAVELESYSSEARIALAFELERSGQFDTSEQELLRAVEIDRTHRPAIALANFYARRGDSGKFWQWIQQAASFSPAGLDQAIELCLRAADEPLLILERGLPDTRQANRRFLELLLAQDRLDAAGAAWDRLQRDLQPGDGPLGSDYVDKLLRRGDITRAVEVWNRMCSARLISYEPVFEAGGSVLTNPEFEHEPTGIGFDWQVSRPEGIYWKLERQAGGSSALAIDFGGNQAESVTLLAQIVPLAPETVYEAAFRYRTAGLPDQTGVWVGIEDFERGTLLARSGHLRSSEALDRQTIRLRTTSDTDAGRLVVRYERVPGTPRQKGTIWLTGFEMRPAGQPSEQAR